MVRDWKGPADVNVLNQSKGTQSGWEKWVWRQAKLYAAAPSSQIHCRLLIWSLIFCYDVVLMLLLQYTILEIKKQVFYGNYHCTLLLLLLTDVVRMSLIKLNVSEQSIFRPSVQMSCRVLTSVKNPRRCVTPSFRRSAFSCLRFTAHFSSTTVKLDDDTHQP